MSVFVDDWRAKFGRTAVCHLVADTSEELHTMARELGLKRQWCQAPGTYREHYDISLEKRRQAVALGAIETTMRHVGHIISERRPKTYISDATSDAK